MKKHSKISIVLENCESYDFNSEDITVYMQGFRKTFCPSGCMNGVFDCCIIIDKNAKVLNELEDWQTDDWAKRIKQSSDITQIVIDGEIYFTTWADDSEYVNAYQTNIERESEHIFIISKTKKSLEDFL